MSDMDNIIQAKVIILGDESTGKTSLINNLRNLCQHDNSNNTSHLKNILNQNINDNFFTIINISAEELDNSLYDVNLKCWEHSLDTSTQEEQLVFRDALFCIVLIDIRNPTSANSAFNRWIELKETYASECFLFVIGTYLDQANHRQVDLKDICKSCAKRDAIYLEISNQTNQNIPLLKKLLKQRLDYMIERKQIISNRIFTPMYNNNNIDNQGRDNLMNDDNDSNKDKEYNEENKGDGYYSNNTTTTTTNNNNNQDTVDNTYNSYYDQQQQYSSSHSNSTHPTITAAAGQQRGQQQPVVMTVSIPALEQHIMHDSIGSILSSCLDIDHWPGLEDDNNNLIEIGNNINQFIEQLSIEHIHNNLPMTIIDDSIYEQQQHQQPQKKAATTSSYHINKKLTSLNNDLIQNFNTTADTSSTNNNISNDNNTSFLAESYVDSAYSMNELKHAFELLGLEFPNNIIDNNNNTTSNTEVAVVAINHNEQPPPQSSSSPSSYHSEIIANNHPHPNNNSSNTNNILNSHNTSNGNKQSPSNSSIHSGQQQQQQANNNNMVKNKGNTSTTTTKAITTTTTLRKLMVKLPNGTTTVEMILDLNLNLNQQIDRFLTIHHLMNDSHSKKIITTMVYDAYKKFTLTNNNNNNNSNNNNNINKNNTTTGSVISSINNNSMKNINQLALPPPPPPLLSSTYISKKR